jgi:hypothetical protein
MNEDIREQLQRAQLKAQSRYMERLDRAHKEAKALEERLRKFKRGGDRIQTIEIL